MKKVYDTYRALRALGLTALHSWNLATRDFKFSQRMKEIAR